MSKKQICYFVFLFVQFAFLFSFSGKTQTFLNSFESAIDSTIWKNYYRITDSSAFDGIHFGRAESIHLYSHLLEVPLADSIHGENLSVNFEAFFRLAHFPSKAVFVFSILREDSLLFWYGVKIDDQISDPHKWSRAEAAFQLPASHASGVSVKAYLWNPGAVQIDLDALKIRLETLKTPLFTPKINSEPEYGIPSVLFKNDWYKLLFYPESGSVVLADTNDRKMIHPLVCFSEVKRGKSTKQYYTSKWKKKESKKNENYRFIHLISKLRGQKISLVFKVNDQDGILNFEIETLFRKKTILKRQSLIAFYTDEPHQIFRRNSLMDTANFQHEYHLGNGGASIGKDHRNFMFIHSNDLSSVQLNTDKKMIVFNMDYEEDHRMMHYPLHPDSSDYFVDWSASLLSKGEKLSSTFKWNVSQQPVAMPRLMPVPDGFEAAVVWTEHADWTDIRTHRAVNFGHEDILNPSDAVGGFVKYNIPVTKSVFFNNPDSILNASISSGTFKDLHATIETDTLFFDLLKQLKAVGHEICLHTPEQYTSTQQNMEVALDFMQKNFGSPTWIDHGFNNKPENNRENLVCDGLVKKSEYYAASLWKKYGVKFFWNPYFEEVNPYKNYTFNAFPIIPYPGFGDAFPTALISRHPNRVDVMLWATSGTLEVADNRQWDYLFDIQRLSDLVTHRSIWINHVYPAWVSEDKGFWEYDQNGKIVALQGFDRALERIAFLRDAGLLLPTTISELLQYRNALLSIEYHIDNSGQISITNHNPFTIEGLSFAVNASEILVNGQIPSMKKTKSDTIFWFDLPANQTVKILTRP